MEQFVRTCSSSGYETSLFDFDAVYNEIQKQDKFYRLSVKPLVQSFVEGESATVALFGPTQSGKTYTLNGKAGKDRGIVPRAVEDILAIVRNTYDGDDDFINRSSVIEDYGTDTQPLLSVNALGNRFGLPGAPPQAYQRENGIQVYEDA